MVWKDLLAEQNCMNQFSLIPVENNLKYQQGSSLAHITVQCKLEVAPLSDSKANATSIMFLI